MTHTYSKRNFKLLLISSNFLNIADVIHFSVSELENKEHKLTVIF